jgi:hypothetical protein
VIRRSIWLADLPGFVRKRVRALLKEQGGMTKSSATMTNWSALARMGNLEVPSPDEWGWCRKHGLKWYPKSAHQCLGCKE